MDVPIACFSCKRRDIGFNYRNYKELLRKGYTESDALAELNIIDDCCRTTFMTANDLSGHISAAGRPETVTYKMKERGEAGTAELGQMIIRGAHEYPQQERFVAAKNELIPSKISGKATFTSYESVEYFDEPKKIEDEEVVTLNGNKTEQRLLNFRPTKHFVRLPKVGTTEKKEEVQNGSDVDDLWWSTLDWIVGQNVPEIVEEVPTTFAGRSSFTLRIPIVAFSFAFVRSEEVFSRMLEGSPGSKAAPSGSASIGFIEINLTGLTNKQLIESVNEAVNQKINTEDYDSVRGVKPNRPYHISMLLFALRYHEMIKEDPTVTSMRQFLGSSMHFQDFDVVRERLLLRFVQNFGFSEHERLATEIMANRVISRSERSREGLPSQIILADGNKFTYESAVYLDDELRESGFEEVLVGKKIELVVYPKIMGKKELPLDMNYLTIMFFDETYLILKSDLRFGAIKF